MNKNDTPETQSNAEQELVLKGCESYLEVIYAINAFEISVCRKARETFNDRTLERISRVMALEAPTNLAVNFYVSREKSADENFHGEVVQIGARLWLGKPIDGLLYLVLELSKNSKGEMQKPEVCFALEARPPQAKGKLEEFCRMYSGHPRFYRCEESAYYAIELAQPLEDPRSLSERFANVLNDALQWRERTKSGKAHIGK